MVGQTPCRLIAIAGAELSARTIAVGVHRGLGHAQLARNLLRTEVPVHQPQALALTRRQTFDKIHRHPCAPRKIRTS